MKFFKIFRAMDWWEPKIIPLLTIGYLTILLQGENLLLHIGWLLFIILAIVAGAIYVSIINDFTDLKFDVACGKANRLERFSPLKRKFMLSVSILLAISFSFFFSDDMLSLIFYLAAYLSFSLYSIAPFRFKEKGVLGVIADACGAHLFPSLLVVSSMSHKLGVEIDLYWLIFIGIWSFSYGLRGILWHQFWDRENDLSIGVKTFATTTSLSAIKPVETVIFAFELTSLFLILNHIGKPLPFIMLFVYFLTLIGFKKLKIQSVLILSPNSPYHVLMTEFYLILLPFSLIATCSFQNPYCLVIMIFHIIFFPANTKLYVKRVLLMLNLKKY